MKQKKYDGLNKTYVVVHVTGCGTVEDNFIEHDVMFETDDLADAESMSGKLTLENNKMSDVKSGWHNNRYHIHINTNSEYGGQLTKEQHDLDVNSVCSSIFSDFKDGDDISILGIKRRYIVVVSVAFAAFEILHNNGMIKETINGYIYVLPK